MLHRILLIEKGIVLKEYKSLTAVERLVRIHRPWECELRLTYLSKTLTPGKAGAELRVYLPNGTQLVATFLSFAKLTNKYLPSRQTWKCMKIVFDDHRKGIVKEYSSLDNFLSKGLA